MSEHIVSRKLYFGIFFALLVLTAVTTSVAFVDLGNFNIVVAMLIAGLKASLVILFFMHVKFSTKITKMFVIAGFFWLFLMMAITMTDYLTRDWLTYRP
jgi:cytochrome c oxidase subunit 4